MLALILVASMLLLPCGH